MATLIPACLTDKRLKIRFSRLPEGVKRRVGGGGEVELVLFSRVRRWCNHELDDGFVRVYITAFYYRLLSRLCRERRLMVGVGETASGWQITYGDGEELSSNILYFLEDSTALLPGYVKTSRGRIMPIEFYQALTSIDGLEKELGRIRKYRPLVKDILGLQHSNIPIQLDLWGREVIFRGKGQTTLYGHPIPT